MERMLRGELKDNQKDGQKERRERESPRAFREHQIICRLRWLFWRKPPASRDYCSSLRSFIVLSSRFRRISWKLLRSKLVQVALVTSLEC
jgi:hypothetical protein